MPWSDDPDCCDHLDYETDILTGVATCTNCGHRWHQTAAELERERLAQIEWDKHCEEWEREACPPRAWELPHDGTLADKDDDELPF